MQLFALIVGIMLTGATAGPLTLQTLQKALPAMSPQSRVPQRNAALESLLLSLLEDLRELILTGSDDIPVLDPFDLDYLHLDGAQFNLPGSHVTLEKTIVNNLSKFVIDNLSVSSTSIILQRYRVILDLHIPDLEVNIESYDLFVKALGFDLFGAGQAKVNLIEPRVHANLVVGPRITIGNGLFLNIFSSEVSFKLTGFEPELTGMFNDPSASSFVNLFLKHLVPDLVEFYEDEITELLSTLVQDIGNEILRDVNVGSIIRPVM